MRILRVGGAGAIVVAITAAAAIAVTVLSAAQGQTTRPQLRVRAQFDRPRDLDPIYHTAAPEYFINFNIYNHLVRWKPGGTELEPDLAERWERSADGRTWTFYLRKGVQFHKNYGELTADDVKFTFERFVDKALASPYAGDWANLQRIDVVDRHTVRFTLKEPNFVFLANPIAGRASLIVSRRAVTEKGKGYSRDPIGTGPFVFESWSASDEVATVANDRYFGGTPKVGRIVFVPIIDEPVAVAAIERGEIQAMWTRGSAEAVQVLRGNKNLTVAMVRRPSSVRLLAVNTQNPALADTRIRAALAHAINRKELEIGSGGSLVQANHILPSLPWIRAAEEAGQFTVYRYDPARTKRLLTEAGHTQFRVGILYSLRSPDPLIAQILAEQFRRAGIDVQLDGVENRAYINRWRAGQFQLSLRGAGRGFDPDELARDLLHTSNFPPGDNMARYDRADALVDAGAREPDPARRRTIYLNLLKQVSRDLPYIPLANDNLVAAWRAPIQRMTTGVDNDFPAMTIELGR